MFEGRGGKYKKGNSIKLDGTRGGHAFTHSVTLKWTIIAESVCECIYFFCSFCCCCYISHSFSQHFLGGISLFYCFSTNSSITQNKETPWENINKKGRKKSSGSTMLSLHVCFCLFFCFSQIQIRSLHLLHRSRSTPPGHKYPCDWGTFQSIFFSLNVRIWYHFVKTVWSQSCCRGVFVSSVRMNTLWECSDTAPDWLRRAGGLWNQKKSINSWLCELASADLPCPASFCS